MDDPYKSNHDGTDACLPALAHNQAGPENPSAGGSHYSSNQAKARASWNFDAAPWRAGEFYKLLPPQAVQLFESLALPYSCNGSDVLLAHGASPNTVLFLVEGKVKVTLNSIDGRRLILGIAAPGDILGLAAVISGLPYEITAEAHFPCILTSLPRNTFLEFLLQYPVATLNVGHQLSADYNRACELLRTLGIRMNSGTRLARLLLKWCAEGNPSEAGMRITCSFTHEEIGECIGIARETVSRTLSDLKLRELVVQHGSTLIISSVRALENYADQNDA
jgi:CRP/FNR family transcriptional regulator